MRQTSSSHWKRKCSSPSTTSFGFLSCVLHHVLVKIKLFHFNTGSHSIPHSPVCTVDPVNNSRGQILKDLFPSWLLCCVLSQTLFAVCTWLICQTLFSADVTWRAERTEPAPTSGLSSASSCAAAAPGWEWLSATTKRPPLEPQPRSPEVSYSEGKKNLHRVCFQLADRSWLALLPWVNDKTASSASASTGTHLFQWHEMSYQLVLDYNASNMDATAKKL